MGASGLSAFNRAATGADCTGGGSDFGTQRAAKTADAERDEDDRELCGVVDHEHVRREPSEDRVTELGNALHIEDFAHDEKPRIDSRTSRGV